MWNYLSLVYFGKDCFFNWIQIPLKREILATMSTIEILLTRIPGYLTIGFSIWLLRSFFETRKRVSISRSVYNMLEGVYWEMCFISVYCIFEQKRLFFFNWIQIPFKRDMGHSMKLGTQSVTWGSNFQNYLRRT
jgi:hypothetical protein